MESLRVLLEPMGSDQCGRREVIPAGRIGVGYVFSVSDARPYPTGGFSSLRRLRRCAPRQLNGRVDRDANVAVEAGDQRASDAIPIKARKEPTSRLRRH